MRVPAKTSVACIAFLAVGFGAGSLSDWAAVSSDHRALQGLSIVGVGSVSQESYTNYRTYQTIEWFEFKESYQTDFCFLLPNYIGVWGYGDKAALIVMDDQENYGMAFFESAVGNVRVELEPFQLVDCPSR